MSQARDRETGGRPTRVAVVEDNADNRLLVSALLSEIDVETVEYADAEAALSNLATACVDLVLLDISLPRMSGLELLVQLRSDPALAGLPVIALTAHAMSGDKERYLASGFDDYVSKPILDEQVLFSAIREQLEL